ncbi:MAG: VOC family protein [Sphingobium phenoxybenzoativorans]
MYNHNMVGSNDVAASKKFYDATFQAIGGAAGTINPNGRVIYTHNDGMFLVSAPRNGEPATVGNGCTIGFAMESVAQVDAWHRAGVENGGTAIEDPPGVREGSGGTWYLAYLRDPTGNKLCAAHRLA